MKKQIFSITLFLLIMAGVSAQSEFAPIIVSHGIFLGETGALRDFPTVAPKNNDDEENEVREIYNNMRVPPKNNPNALPLNGADPIAQSENSFRSPQDILVNFDGVDFNESGGFIPPDPSGAVGPNHYVQAVNVVVKIFDKTGDVLLGPTSLGTFLGSGNNNGDPIIMYDQLADRFFVSQFRVSDDALIIGISTTPDPTGTYNVYEYSLDAFPDYPHYSVWPSAYFMTANKNQGNVVYALDRVGMLAGITDPVILGFNLPGAIRNPNTIFGPTPANLLGTEAPIDAPGYIVYLQDDGWSNSIPFDQLKVWEVRPNFAEPNLSRISIPAIIPTSPFDSTFAPFGQGEVPQPGTSQKLTSQSGIVSYMVNYRSFDDHNSMILNFNTDVGEGRIGIRWYELRNTDNNPFSIFQESTWSRNDIENRFMGSMGMDLNGNIALAYSVSSSETRPSLRFTGRLSSDPLNQMSFEEQTIKEGIGSHFQSDRFGDYSQMTMDPDGETFWFTSEYFRSNNAWRTRVAGFNLDNIPVLGTLDQTENYYNVSVYPINEGTHEIFVASKDVVEDLNFEVYDIQGKKLKTGTMINAGKGYRGTFNSSDLSTGVYLVKINGKANTSTIKVSIK